MYTLRCAFVDVAFGQLEKDLLGNAKLRGRQKRGGKSEFNVQICSTDGRLLAEYSLPGRENEVKDLQTAEFRVRKRLENQSDDRLIVIVSEDADNGFQQVQSEVSGEVARR